MVYRQPARGEPGGCMHLGGVHVACAAKAGCPATGRGCMCLPVHATDLLLPRSPSSAPLLSGWQAEPGSKIQLGRVLALKHDGKFQVGTPYMEGIKVEAEVLEEIKGPKV